MLDEAHIQARLGKCTASRVADATARTKTGWGASRATYMAELITERLTGVQAPSYVSAAMQWGLDNEADAVAAYNFRRSAEIEPVGFVPHPTIAFSGASPDGLVGKLGLVEFKCPNTSTHLDYLLRDDAPPEYYKQMQWQMACTGRKWCDFVSFDPRLPPQMRLWICRVPRDNLLIEVLTGEVNRFLREMDEKITALCERYKVQPKILAEAA